MGFHAYNQETTQLTPEPEAAQLRVFDCRRIAFAGFKLPGFTWLPTDRLNYDPTPLPLQTLLAEEKMSIIRDHTRNNGRHSSIPIFGRSALPSAWESLSATTASFFTPTEG